MEIFFPIYPWTHGVISPLTKMKVQHILLFDFVSTHSSIVHINESMGIEGFVMLMSVTRSFHGVYAKITQWSIMKKLVSVIYLLTTRLGISSILFFIMIFIFSIIAGLQCSINFLLCIMVTQLYIYVYILFSPIILLNHKWLDIVLRATQQDFIANPFQRQ